jgi:hypothetical protein
MSVSSTYWKVGSGNVFDGGFIGAVNTHDEHGIQWTEGHAKPEGAVDIDGSEYKAILAAMVDQWPQKAQTLVDSIEAAKVERDGLYASAIAKLVAGEPLTEAEARSMGAYR